METPEIHPPYRTIEVQDAVLVNRSYWDRIKQRVEKENKQPTVYDVVESMRMEGSTVYYTHDWAGSGQPSPHLFPHKAETPLRASKETGFGHELSHIIPRVGHTPQQELLNAVFYSGMRDGLSPLEFDSAQSGSAKRSLEAYLNSFIIAGRGYQSIDSDPVSGRDKAVYYAAGIYFRLKMEAYLDGDYQNASYETQKAFCVRYSDPKSDHIPRPCYSAYFGAQEIEHAPAEILTITPEEWRAIEATALKLQPPEKTAFPKRMECVAEALDHVGLSYDMKPELEKAKRNHARNHPEGEAFDMEKFLAAREKREAPQR